MPGRRRALSPIKDKAEALHDQVERERELRQAAREAAARYLDGYARRHGWPDDDLINVKDALGLTLDQSLGFDSQGGNVRL